MLPTLIIWRSILIFGCSLSEFNENKIVAQPELSLTAPNGIRLANSTEEIITNTKSGFDSSYGPGITYTIIKISYGGVALFEKQAANDGVAVAKIAFRTSKGQAGDFIYVGKAESRVN